MAPAIPWIGLGLSALGTIGGMTKGGKGKKIEYENIQDPEDAARRRELMDYMFNQMRSYDERMSSFPGMIPNISPGANLAQNILPNMFLGQGFGAPGFGNFGDFGLGMPGVPGPGGSAPAGGGAGGGGRSMNPWEAYRQSLGAGGGRKRRPRPSVTQQQ